MRKRLLTIALLGLGLPAAGCGQGDVSPRAQLDPFDIAAGHHDAAVASRTAPAPTRVPAKPPEFTPGVFPCSQCHEGGPPDVGVALTLNHAAHLSRGLECVDCHDPEEEGDPGPADAEFCGECHEPGEIEGNVKAYFDAVTGDDGEIAFPRRWKTRDVEAQHPRHAEADVECAACHGEPGAGPVPKPKPVTLMKLCMDCHTEREQPNECETCHTERLEPVHADIVLNHAEEQRSCPGCHNPEDRDTLRLANGQVIPFEESYRLCGQCHGPTLRDWRAGLHGKRTGNWRGEQRYSLCAHCHNPHDPAYPEMPALPAPARPRGSTPSGDHHE